MIIILEGENKTGKTTLANYIRNCYDFDVIKCSQPKGDPYVEYMKILKQIEKSGRNTVIDRFVYGEFVYGPLYRGKSSLTKTQLRNIELKALSLNAHLIYCHDTVDNIERRFKEEGEEFAKPQLIKRTLDLFAGVINDAILPKTYHQMRTEKDLTSRVERFDGPEVTGTVVELIIKKRRDKKNTVLLDQIINSLGYWDRFKHLKTAVGNQNDPRLVLVGEQPNLKLKPEYKRFRQAFDFGVSAEYLFGELLRAHIKLSDVMIMNSDSKELKDINEYFPIVALGRVAAKRLDKLGRNHYALNHPSYERRFHGKKHKIAKILADAMDDFDDDMDC